MACPYFLPQRRVEGVGRAEPARAPLGAIYAGLCLADAGSSRQPDPEQLFGACNFGYGRGVCSHFPQTASADAVRFSLYEGGGTSTLTYVLEENGSPVSHGVIHCTAGLRLEPPAVGSLGFVLGNQAKSFLESYRSWKIKT